MYPWYLCVRVILAVSFPLNVACQLYGMLTTPKEVADANHFAFSPHPLFIVVAFAVQVVLQLYWVVIWFYATHKFPEIEEDEYSPSDPDDTSNIDKEAHAPRREITFDDPWPRAKHHVYAPIYALGVLCMAAWMFFRMKEWFWAAQVMVTINVILQLFTIYYVFLMFGPYDVHIPTEVVSRIFAGISILQFLDNGAVALGHSGPPSVPVQILTVVLFIFLALYTDIIFGLCIFYDALALLVGQPTWRPALQTAVGLLGVLIPVRYGYLWFTEPEW
ncbi:hypothetical protein BU15DRAFT_70688 [Melanogaster broomeanus]|nr:hypothetical protein BU15DRAFT_70688 [Melanogaster broomeanus]